VGITRLRHRDATKPFHGFAHTLDQIARRILSKVVLQNLGSTITGEQ
jgi:hypothetical protein